MLEQLFKLPEHSTATLQKQIQEILVKAILDGHLPRDKALPSGRKLAEQLGVARNTVVFAYQQLVDDGFLVSRQRSGHFISPTVTEGYVHREERSVEEETPSAVRWKRLQSPRSSLAVNCKPGDWYSYDYPFIYGQ